MKISFPTFKLPGQNFLLYLYENYSRPLVERGKTSHKNLHVTGNVPRRLSGFLLESSNQLYTSKLKYLKPKPLKSRRTVDCVMFFFFKIIHDKLMWKFRIFFLLNNNKARCHS